MAIRWRSWIPTLTFWTLFLISLGLGKRYPVLNTVWYLAGMLFLLIVSLYSLIHIYRHRHETSSISYRGVPRWLERFSLDEPARNPSEKSRPDID